MPEDNPTPALPPSLQWTARADWIDAEDGTVVCLRPSWDERRELPESDALWPERRAMLAAVPQMLAALEPIADALSKAEANAANSDSFDRLIDASLHLSLRDFQNARAAIAAARAS